MKWQWPWTGQWPWPHRPKPDPAAISPKEFAFVLGEMPTLEANLRTAVARIQDAPTGAIPVDALAPYIERTESGAFGRLVVPPPPMPETPEVSP